MSKRCNHRQEWMSREEIYSGREVCRNCEKEVKDIYEERKRFIVL